MTIWLFRPAKPALGGRSLPPRGRPARPGRACAGPPRWRRRRGAAARPAPRRAAASIFSAPRMRLPARASSPSRSSAACRSAASIRAPRSAGTATVAGLERAGQRALQLALGLGRVERGPVDADPGAAARARGRARPARPRRPGRARGGSARPAPAVAPASGCSSARAYGFRLAVVIGRFPHPRPPRLSAHPRPRTSGRGRP